MLCLVDCDSFYASCEKVFRPDLRTRPVIVLSNNDGCVVARCPLAKSIGVPDLVPYFQIEPLVRRHKIAVFSSNFALYGDLSSRVMETLRPLSERLEVYSIDEAFLHPWCPGGDYEAAGQRMRDSVWQNVRIPVSVGMAKTKTLAKLATRAAKKIPTLNRVCVLRRDDQRKWLLKRAGTQDIWGVGRRIGERLSRAGIETAWQLSKVDPAWARREFSVCLQRTIEELNGQACLDLELAPPPKKQIVVSRSYGIKCTELGPIREATAAYAARACQKLRQQGSRAAALMVFLETSRHAGQRYASSATVSLPYPTSDTRLVVRSATAAIGGLYRPGLRYIKSGIMLLDLSQAKNEQADMFRDAQRPNDTQLMDTLDAINSRYGRGTIYLAAEGHTQKTAMRQGHLSKRYTTSWDELKEVTC